MIRAIQTTTAAQYLLKHGILFGFNVGAIRDHVRFGVHKEWQDQQPRRALLGRFHAHFPLDLHARWCRTHYITKYLWKEYGKAGEIGSLMLT